MDQLTGLGSRVEFAAWLAQAGADATGIWLDIDAFNGVAATLGHVEGDRILVELARWLEGRAAMLGLAAFRVGGDEFVVAGAGLSDDRLREVAAGLVRESGTLGLPYAHPLNARKVLSLSAATFRAGSTPAKDWPAALDVLARAVHQAKVAGGKDHGVVAAAGPIGFPPPARA